MLRLDSYAFSVKSAVSFVLGTTRTSKGRIMRRTIRVLAIDGGGIRGIIPARVLVEIEKLTRRSIAELFDLIVGTSTGGILALGLTTPGSDGPAFSAAQLLDLYLNYGEII